MNRTPRPQEIPARVIESFGRRVRIEMPDGTRCAAELFGRRLSVVCGDEVRVRPSSRGDAPRVVAVAPRRTLFARTDSRGRTEPLAANLSLLAVIVAPQPTPDPFVADRYLAGAAYAGIEAAVVASKTDLPDAATPPFVELLAEYEQAGYTVLRTSATTGAGIDALRGLLDGQLAMLVGQSGVGKSSLTNLLAPESGRLTRTLSDATGEGRHTTVSTALFKVPSGGELIDSPGVRDYAPALVDDATVQQGWKEMVGLAPQCRFHNCLHLREPGCAVRAAVESGDIAARRYESYKRLLNIMRDLAPEYERRRP